MQENRKITVGVTGGVAAYKAVELVRALQTAGLDPHVVMTRAAEQFIQPLTFAAITGHRVITSLWANEGSDNSSEANLNSAIDHIDEAQTTRALVVAPATAHIIARFAHGLADDFLSTLYLATTAPVIVAPAMNVNMWNHPATQANLEILRARGVRIVEPGSGYLACGMVGSGRLVETPAIVDAVLDSLRETTQDLKAETILITAGGTREPIDPVRFVGNRSSGRMGYALAAAAAARGARVILVTAATLPTPPHCEAIPVTTAEQMHDAVLAHLPEATIVIKTAAVADFRPTTIAAQKLKRNGPLTLTLEPTPDIARDVAQHRRPGTLLIAFAAETDPEAALPNARAKLAAKGADALFLNDVSNPAIGFDSPHNAGTWITPHEERTLPLQTKSALATQLLNQIAPLRTHTNIPA
ncbi:bifunctional phosphopantothenoylcysteine decarboxylase/phosphopantothenate--cysteine ligase CoaBC [Granulicella arctica]|uniref:Coenzyme A biosynthesis bifunctional protein CoaBC n=1 Tax=Granulicella arctica TaxID=940613 RepID=A0A7Y9PFF8_9BACT|nr:bifunctional phosphopantothenoylcysteine decarboxylase/phosphopantothenate--cysteine ligase CoaBC [Granulicella arctica]NYF78704.1 phosphopantothenoylcysteine decarboxylase/phosphopantothenate--cysteine ligase [Granulicella arctica]